MNKKVFVVFLFFPAICLGQPKNNLKPVNSLTKDNYSKNNLKDSLPKTILKINLSSLIDIFSFPTLQFSAEKRITKQMTLCGEIGYQLYNAHYSDTGFVKPHGIKANLEIRYYRILTALGALSTIKEGLPGSYLGLNLFYRQNKGNMQLNYRHEQDNTGLSDCLWFNKINWGANLVLGYQQYVSKNVLIDLYAGAGMLYRVNRNYNREYNKNTDVLLTGIDLNVPTIINEGTLTENGGWRGNITFGCRVGINL